MESSRGRPSIEDLTMRIESVLRRQRNSSNLSLQGADFKQLFFEQHRLRLQREEQIEILRIRLRRMNEQRHHNNFVCTRCWTQQSHVKDNSNVNNFRTFSELMDVRMGKMFSSMKSGVGSVDDRHLNDLDVIQNLSVFGVPEQTILNPNADNQGEDFVDGKVVLSVRSTSYIEEQAAKLVFPSGMAVKKVTGEKIVHKVTELITKSYSNQNSFLLTFEAQAARLASLSEESIRLIDILNPSRRLFCVCIGTYDFTYMGKHSDAPDSYSITEMPSTELRNRRVISSEHLASLSELSCIQPSHEVGITQRVYCITSYLPFFSFFEEVILSILNIVKVQRLEIYQHQVSDVKKIDSRFQIQRFKQIYDDNIKKFNKNRIRLNSKYILKLLNDTMMIRTLSQTVEYEPINEWVFQILSIFTIDTFMDLLTLFLLEDKLVFVCENSHILTFSIYLFVQYLYRPFGYAFASVYIVPNEQFLNAPFPVVYGLLKKKKWLQENRIIERFQNTYVFLSPGGVNIVYTESRKDLLKKRPQKLKNLLTPFFRDLEKRKKTTKKFTKTDETSQYMYHSNKEERQISVSIVQSVNKYLSEEVLRWLPPKEQMTELRKKIQKTEPPKHKDPHTYMMDCIISHLVEQRKPKDPFFEQILLTQTLNVFISKRCGCS